MWMSEWFDRRADASWVDDHTRHFMTLVLLSLIMGACSQSESPSSTTGEGGGRIYTVDQVNCDLFSREDAAAILGAPAAQIKVASEVLYEGNRNCSFNGGGLDKLLSFNISLSPNIEKAVLEMAQYRSHLEVAQGIKPFKDDSANGAYSEVDGLGDEALWTAVNSTLTVRRGNASLQISLPKEREIQQAIAEKLLSRL